MPSWPEFSPRLLLIIPFIMGLFELGNFLAPKALSRSERRFVSACLGLIISHLILYVGLPLSFSVITVSLVGMVGIWRRRREWKVSWDTRLIVLVTLSLFTLFMIVAETLFNGDARLIWFRHGEWIFRDGGLWSPNWAEADVKVVHADYPKLIGILSAQMAWLLGGFDNRWVKLSLAVLVWLEILGMYLLPLRKGWLCAVHLVLFGGIGYLLWNGQMDGHLAIMIFLATNFLGNFLKTRRLSLLWCALCALSLCAQMKNEGTVLALILLGVFIVLDKSRRETTSSLRRPVSAILIAPVILWALLKKVQGIQSDLVSYFDASKSWERLLSSDFWRLMFSFYLQQSVVFLILFAILIALFFIRRERRPWQSPEVQLGLFSFFLYMVVVFLTYVGTYWILENHLATSFWRIALSAYGLLFASILLIIESRNSSPPSVEE